MAGGTGGLALLGMGSLVLVAALFAAFWLSSWVIEALFGPVRDPTPYSRETESATGGRRSSAEGWSDAEDEAEFRRRVNRIEPRPEMPPGEMEPPEEP